MIIGKCPVCGEDMRIGSDMTNADRIRSMTDEELARFIAGQRGWYCDYKDPSDDEYPNVINWLKEDADG